MPELDASQVDGDTYVLNEQTDKDSAMCKFLGWSVDLLNSSF